MELDIARHDLYAVRAIDRPGRPLEPGEVRLAVERFGLSANNVTYAVFGEAMRYWEFFPVPGDDGTDWGHLPVWGFGHVTEVAGGARPEQPGPAVPVGTRVFGYFPLATELVVRPGRDDATGFSDVAAHRSTLPSVYNRYAYAPRRNEADAAAERRDALEMLIVPLFVTSFVVDDFAADNGLFGASMVVLSSASSKTAMGAAFLFAERPGIEVVGLTSAANMEFTAGLGCYHRVLTYDQTDEIPVRDALYVDVAGRRDVTRAVHAHLGERLRYSMVVGDTHWDHADEGGTLSGPEPILLFAPDQIAKRRRQWGREEFDARTRSALDRFAGFVGGWMELRTASGPGEVERVYRDLLGGRADPAVGYACTLQEDDDG